MKTGRILVCVFFCGVLVLLTSAVSLAEGQKRQNADRPLVFFNTNTNIWEQFAINKGFRNLANALRDNGYDVDQGVLTGIDEQVLNGVDILVLVAPAFSLLSEDKAALKKWIREGGGLMVVAHYSASDISNLDSFLKEFGITFGQSYINKWTALVDQKSELAGPRSCNTIGYAKNNISTFFVNVDNAKGGYSAARITSKNASVAALSRNASLGKGRLVVFGTPEVFYYGFFFELDNGAFTLNAIDYLAGGSSSWDLKPVLCKYKGKNLQAGDKVTLIARIKNIGGSASDKTKVSFIISDDGSLTGPPVSMFTLNTVTLASLEAGKKKKFKVKGKLPTWVAAGSYYLHVVVDPDGKTDDADPANNALVAKNQIEVN